MRWPRFVVLIVVASVLQAGLLGHLRIKPDLLLILLVFFAIYSNTTEARLPRGLSVGQAIISAFSIGFAADVIGSAMGPQIISFGLFGTALAYLHRVIAIRKMPYQGLVIFVTGFLAGYLSHILNLLTGQPIPPDIHPILLTTALFSALIGPFLFLPTAWWMRIKTSRFRRR